MSQFMVLLLLTAVGIAVRMRLFIHMRYLFRKIQYKKYSEVTVLLLALYQSSQ